MKNFEIPKGELFIISEIANAHNGSTKKLEKLVDEVIKIKPNAIKFQFFKTADLLTKHHSEFSLYKKLEIPDKKWAQIFSKIRKNKIKIFVDVFSLSRAKFAQKLGVDAFKIHSSDINNLKLLKYLAPIGKPILLSCSGCKLNEIDSAVYTIKKNGNSQIVLMHGFQGFPTKMSEINLSRITSLKNRYSLPVGYMDHIDANSELAQYLPLIAVGIGANIIEKHITLNRDLKEEDYQSSLNPDEFLKMQIILWKSFKSLGSKSFHFHGSEINYRKNMKKQIVSKRSLGKNYKIKEKDVLLRRIFSKSSEIPQDRIIGGITKKIIKKEELFDEKNIFSKRKIAAIIACRVDSTRLYAKPLQLVGKETILEHILYQIKQSKLIDEILLSISEKQGNEKFVEFALRNGLKYVKGSDHDVLKRIIDGANHVNASTIVRVTSEDPIKYWQGIDPAIKFHITSGSDYTPCVDDLPEGTGFEIIQLDALKKSHKKGKKKHRSELVTSYIIENQNQFKITPFMVPKVLQKPEIRMSVDNPEDLILVREIWAKLMKKKKLPNLKEILDVINNISYFKQLHYHAKLKSHKT